MSGVHKAFIFDRGGEHRIGEVFPLTQTRWSRVRDDQSSGNVRLANPARACWPLLEKIDSARHELVIYRNGRRVWEGPLVRDDDSDGVIELDARDITFYTERTIMRRAYNNAYPHITYGPTRLGNILRAELARRESLEPPINVVQYLDIRTTRTTAKTARSTLPYESTVFDELDEMAARSGIDYTVVGRRMIINDTDESIGQGPMLTDDDFTGGLSITGYGRETATYSAVTDGRGKHAASGGTDPYYGLIELLTTAFGAGDSMNASTTITAAEMTKEAQRNRSGRYPTPRVLRVPDGSTLNPDTADRIMDYLIPGVRFPVRATRAYRDLRQMQKLDKVVFTETPTGEEIKVSLGPAPGVAPWDDTGSGTQGET